MGSTPLREHLMRSSPLPRGGLNKHNYEAMEKANAISEIPKQLL